MNITIQVLRDQTAFEAMAEKWNALLVRSASHVPFLRHEYLTTWWRTRGGGEWANGELYVATGYEVDGGLAGIAPLFYTENRDGEPALMLLGSIEISDFLDVIAPPDRLGVFLARLLDHLDGPEAPPWEVLDWYNLLADSPTLPGLKAAAHQRGWTYSQAHYRPAPCVALPGAWETYLAGLEKKQRHEIRRKLRRVAAHPDPVRWYIVQEAGRLEGEIEAFLNLMALDPQKAGFLTPLMRSQMQFAAHRAFQAGWLQLSFLEVGGEKAAGYLNFDYGNRIWSYNSGWDLRFAELSPGWVLLAHLLKWANQQGRVAFDFLRGDETYKYRFGGVDRFVERVTVRR